MDVRLWLAGLTGFLAALAFLQLLRRLLSADRVARLDPDWYERFSITRYRPMERLLSGEDREFLVAQAGFRPQILKTLRAERRRIFRGYLRCLSRDFNRLYLAGRLLMLDAAEDRPDLARILLRQRVLFAYAMLAVEIRLLLHALGVGTVDVRLLVASLEEMRARLRPVGAAQAA